MKIFDKKLLISIFFLLIIILISIYFFTKDDSYEFIAEDEFYIPTESPEIAEDPIFILVHVEGEVINPGVVSIPENSRILDAIVSAGGTTALADTSKINLAYSLKDGQKIYVPSIYDEDEVVYIQTDAGINVIVPDISPSATLININSATQAELESLPNIGPATASKIIDYRTKNGNFKSIEDIMNVSGIGESKFNNIKNYICI